MAADFIEQEWEPAFHQATRIISRRASGIDEVIVCGCGDSHHAARNLELALMLWTGRRVRAAPAMEASRYLIPSARSNADRTLVVGISASGEVARTIEAIEMAIAKGMPTLAITGSPESTLGRSAEMTFSLITRDFPAGPGLINYLASLLMGYGLAVGLAPQSRENELSSALEQVPEVLRERRTEQIEMGEKAARNNSRGGVVFLGSGPAYGSALFSAAKAIEAAGVQAWGQDVEEWAHLEYFCEPSRMPTWLLSSKGRSHGRETEIKAAANAIRRQFYWSVWGSDRWSLGIGEALAPLGLWVGPVAFANQLAVELNERPFRDFGGGRSQIEGGGASRIRTSVRISLEDVSLD
jgi:glucosamine--fructose-6-phosphate aminotransferase (isomerizing)